MSELSKGSLILLQIFVVWIVPQPIFTIILTRKSYPKLLTVKGVGVVEKKKVHEQSCVEPLG
jgi:hypothetical protein